MRILLIIALFLPACMYNDYKPIEPCMDIKKKDEFIGFPDNEEYKEKCFKEKIK